MYMRKIFKQLIAAIFAVAICSMAFSQQRDSTRFGGGNGGFGGRQQTTPAAPKPYKEVITIRPSPIPVFSKCIK